MSGDSELSPEVEALIEMVDDPDGPIAQQRDPLIRQLVEIIERVRRAQSSGLDGYARGELDHALAAAQDALRIARERRRGR